MHTLRWQSLSRLLERVIWITLLVLIPLAAIPHGLSDPWWLAAFECLVFALGALWIVNGFLVGSWSIKGRPMLIPLLVLCVYVVLQGALISADPVGTYRFLFLVVALITFGQLLRQSTSSRRRSSWLIYTTIGVVVGSAVFGLFRLILQRSSPTLSVFGLLPTEGYGQLFNRNYFASMLVMILGLELGLVLAGGVLRKHLLLHLGIITLLATSVVLTNSRGGIFAMMVQVIVLAVLFVMRRSWRNAKAGSRSSTWRRIGRLALGILFICCFVIAMSVAVIRLGGDRLEHRLEKLSSEVDDDASDPTHARRAQVWHASWQLIKANPITGVGFGAYHTTIPMYHDATGSGVPDTAINGYLDLLSGGGIIGCAIFAWFLVAFFWSARVKLRSKSAIEYATCMGALAGLFGFCVHSLVDNGLNVPINAIILTVLIVIATTDSQIIGRDLPDSVNRGDASNGHGINVLVETATMSR